MEKKNFLNILDQYTTSSVTDALDILAYKQQYPYSQILHVLAARVSKEHGFSTQQQELQMAAVYATDRTVLKEVMAAETVNQVAKSIPKVQSDNTTGSGIPKITKTESTISAATPLIAPAITETPRSLNNNDVADRIVNDLNRLNQARNNFESLYESMASGKPIEHIINSDFTELETEEGSDTDKERSNKSKKQRIIEIAKALETNPSTEKVIPIKRKREHGDGLIDQIANSKKELNPETDKQKAQIEAIDQFIKAQPMLGNSKDKPLPLPEVDLSSIKSGDFGNNIISETLVDILLKQGKREKAIEVLKKLIWKFPQKKAYFAAQIEELKK